MILCFFSGDWVCDMSFDLVSTLYLPIPSQLDN